MRKFVLALGIAVAAAGMTGPMLAKSGGVSFQAVAAEGLDAKAGEMVQALQAALPSQMPMFEAGGYSYYGAFAVPTGMTLKPELLNSVANLETAEAAQAAVLDVCKEQTGKTCTVIGLIVPKGN